VPFHQLVDAARSGLVGGQRQFPILVMGVELLEIARGGGRDFIGFETLIGPADRKPERLGRGGIIW